MKIAYYTSNRVVFPPRPEDLAASSVITADIVKNLKDRHEITVYAPKSSSMDSVKIIDLDFENFAIDSSISSVDWKTKSVIGLKQLFLGKVLEDAKNYDIIHLQTEPVYLGMPFVNLVQTPILFTPHHPFYQSDKLIFEFYDGKVNMSAISKYQSSKYPMKQDLPVIYNGLDIEKFGFNPKSKDYFLYLGRFTKEKGVEDFIELAKNNPNDNFVIVGAGALEEAVIIASGNLDNLELKGFLPRGESEWKEVLTNAKALIMPTVGEESFGMVMIEAMAFGTPVISYKKCAAPEIIDDGKNGVIVSELNIDGLKKGIDKINSLDSSKYQMMRQKARGKIERNFTSEVMAKNYEKLYQQILYKN